MSLETKPFEFAKDVDSGDDIALYLSIFLEENGVQGLIEGLKHLAKAKGMSTIANDAGVNRQSLYRSLAKNGNPKIETIDKIVRALGFKLTIEKL
jgi:probable addiction module antidote protein